MHSFALLLLADRLTDEQVIDLYETAPDATISERDGQVTVHFDRDAKSFAEALDTAVHDVAAVIPDAKLIRMWAA